MKRELFNLLSLKGIYLTPYELTIAVSKLSSKDFSSVVESVNELEEYYYSQDKFRDPLQGAYVIENIHLQEVSKGAKKVVATKIDGGEQKHYDSIYKASLDITGSKNGCGNISKTIHGKKKTCYGFTFKFA